MPSSTFQVHRALPIPNPAKLPQWSLIENATSVVESDQRVLCAWLGGSFGEATADRWSDVDFRLVIGDGDFQDFVDADLGLLERISPVVGARARRTAGGETLRVVLFEGAARADFLYITESGATSRPGERSHLLLDRAGIHPTIARLPAERPASRNEILRRLENDIPAALARHRNAIAVGSLIAAFEEHVVLLGCVESLFALLRDPAKAGRLGNKHKGSALTVDDQDRLLATLTPWSDPVAACSSQALDPLLSLLGELAERCDWLEQSHTFLPASHEPTAPGLFAPPIWTSIPAILKMLVHAPVHATYFNRGHWQGVLTGDRIALRAIVNLSYASENDDLEGPTEFPELHLTGESSKSLVECLTPLGECTPRALLESQSRMFEVFAAVGRAAARRHSHAYPFHLESEVFDYLEREGALVRTDICNRHRLPDVPP
ncbi:MAG: hypothetical protein OXG46_11650 [Chloroflexi bacterium]|nr:hypothetical protein [Chloroflexota bacterium]MCY3937928.1 hypothetical protein [Chloroflexota bacterium]